MDSLKLLIVDDDTEMSDFIKLRLSTDAPHFEIASVSSGKECLEYVRENEVDCILSDYQMPGMDGMELLVELREQGNDVPLIFITGQGSEEVAREAFKNGAFDYFTKDIGFAHFARIINSVGQAANMRLAARQRQEAEEAVRDSERLLSSVFSSIEDGLCVIDTDFNIVRVNSTLERWHSHRMPLAGKKCYDVYRNTDAPCEKCPHMRAIKDGAQATAVVSRHGAHGELTGWVEIHSFPWIDERSGELRGVIEHIRDVTDKRRADSAIMESEEKYRFLFEQNPHPMMVYDARTLRFLAVNNETVRHYGFTHDEFLSMSLPDIVPGEDMPVLLEYLTKSADSVRRGAVWRHKKKDGAVIQVDILSKLVEFEGKSARLVLCDDITEKKRSEEERNALYHMLTHDIRGPLSVIYASSGMLVQDAESDESRELANGIRKAAHRIGDLISGMLTISRLESASTDLMLSHVSLPELVRQVASESEPKASAAGVSLKVAADPAVRKIYADGGELSRALGNLVTNAIDYSRKDGLVSLYAGFYEGCPDKVFVEVADDGAGIPDEDLPRIFEKYYRGRYNHVKKGSGLGLAIVKAVVEAHGGSVWCASKQGEGSTFT